MNCEDYRQAITAEPSFDGGAGHLSECAECQDYRRALQALDQTIGRALALRVPELVLPELADVDTDNVVSLAGRRRVSPPVGLAIAATVVLAAVLGIRMLGNGLEYESLADEVLAHVQHEPYALRVTDAVVSEERLGEVVSANIAQLDHSAGLITYAQSCTINGHEVPHLVIQGEYGPVTILLMPEEKISAAVSLSDDSTNGVILPVGDGSIAIIGGSDERLDRIEQKVLQSVMWST